MDNLQISVRVWLTYRNLEFLFLVFHYLVLHLQFVVLSHYPPESG